MSLARSIMSAKWDILVRWPKLRQSSNLSVRMQNASFTQQISYIVFW